MWALEATITLWALYLTRCWCYRPRYGRRWNICWCWGSRRCFGCVLLAFILSVCLQLVFYLSLMFGCGGFRSFSLCVLVWLSVSYPSCAFLKEAILISLFPFFYGKWGASCVVVLLLFRLILCEYVRRDIEYFLYNNLALVIQVAFYCWDVIFCKGTFWSDSDDFEESPLLYFHFSCWFWWSWR